jgi:flagellar motility protein MotE (MotC chaperone)
MSETPKLEKVSRHFPGYIFVAGTIMFVFMLAAIALPDYLHYRLRIEELGLLKAQQAATPLPSPQSSSGASQAGPAQSSSVTPSQSDSANLFESYARFLTLLAGLVSVLGFFLGFFIRRSIRETEEDIDKRVNARLESWGVSYSDQSAKLETKLKEVEALETRLDALEARFRKTLESLEESQKEYEHGTPEVIPDAAEVARKLDSEMERSESQAELPEQEANDPAEAQNAK